MESVMTESTDFLGRGAAKRCAVLQVVRAM